MQGDWSSKGIPVKESGTSNSPFSHTPKDKGANSSSSNSLVHTSASVISASSGWISSVFIPRIKSVETCNA